MGSKRAPRTAKPAGKGWGASPRIFSNGFCGRRGPLRPPKSMIFGSEALLRNLKYNWSLHYGYSEAWCRAVSSLPSQTLPVCRLSAGLYVCRRQLYPPAWLSDRYGSSRSPNPPIWEFPDLHNAGGLKCYFLGEQSAPKSSNSPHRYCANPENAISVG